MKSTEKVAAMLELLQDEEDQELAAAIPLPIGVPTLRMGLMAVAEKLPRDPAELDTFLSQVGDFCLSMRSDDFLSAPEPPQDAPEPPAIAAAAPAEPDGGVRIPHTDGSSSSPDMW